jgi:hypothetical protein
MALFDVDKNGDDRGSPMPNTHDQLAHDAVMAKATNSINYTTGPVVQGSPTFQAGNGQLSIATPLRGTLLLSLPSVTGPNSQQTATLTLSHSLGYVPAVVAFMYQPQVAAIPISNGTLINPSSTGWNDLNAVTAFNINTFSTAVLIWVTRITAGSAGAISIGTVNIIVYILTQVSQ